MAQETQRAQAAAAGVAHSASAGTRIPDAPPSAAPKQATEARNDYELVLGRGQIASCLFAGTVVVAIFAGGAYFAGKLSAMNCVAASNSIPQATAPLRVSSVLPPGVVNPGGVQASIGQSNIGQSNIGQSSIVPPSVVPSSGASSAHAANQSGATPFMVDAPAADAGNKGSGNASTLAATITTAPALNAGTNVYESQTVQPTAAASSNAKGSPLFADPLRGALYLQVGAVEKGMAMIIAEGLRQHGLPSFVAPGPSEKIFRVLVGPLANQDEYKRVKGEVDSIDVGYFARQFEK